MKKLLYTMVLLAGLFSACEEPGTSILYDKIFLELDAATTVTGSKTYSYLRVNDGQGIPSGFIVNLGAAHQSTPINFSFEIDPSSTAIENLHYTLTSQSATIAPNTSTVELPIMILDDNISPEENLDLVINLTSSDVAINPNYETGTHRIQVICESNLEGTYDFTTTESFCGSPTSGTVDIIALGSGSYTFSDWSLGSYDVCYDGFVPGSWGSLTLVDVCNKVSYTGSDAYGDLWTIQELTVDGSDLTIKWDNTYGESSTTTLTRTDGSSWPDLTI